MGELVEDEEAEAGDREGREGGRDGKERIRSGKQLRLKRTKNIE